MPSRYRRRGFLTARRVYDEDTLPWTDVLRQRAAARLDRLETRLAPGDFFVARLVRFRRLRAAIAPSKANRWVFVMIDRATYSTYRDCVDLGAGRAAREILRQPAIDRSPGRVYNRD
ncbi:MAG: hypothetical protein ACRDIY_00980 [Chloroflexota bacterium]